MSKGSNTTRNGGNSTRAASSNGGGSQVDVSKVIADANKAVDWWRNKKADFEVTSIKEESDRVIVRANSAVMNGSIDFTPYESSRHTGGADVDDSDLHWRTPKGVDYETYEEYINNLTGHTYDVVHRAYPGKKIHISTD